MRYNSFMHRMTILAY